MRDEAKGGDEDLSGDAAEPKGPTSQGPSSLIPHPSSLSKWLERATVAFLFLFAAAAPHSIAVGQGAWMLAMLCWVARFAFRPRPAVYRTPVDPWLLGFFVLTFLTALTSYDPEVSIGKLRAASLFTIVYVAAENVRNTKMLRALALTLVASCALGLVHTFGVFAVGHGVKVRALAADSPLRAAGVEEGDTVLSVDGADVAKPEQIEREIKAERASIDRTYRWTDNSIACTWDERVACVRVYRAEVVPAYKIARAGLSNGDTPEARLGILSWSRGRDERASGFYGQYQTYSEVLQLIASLALGMLVALRRRLNWKGALLAVALAGMCGALLLTLTRASWAGFFVSAFVIALVGASRRTFLIMACLAIPLVLAAVFVLHEKRQVGLVDAGDQSTSWRLMVWRDGTRILTSKPRHLLAGVGMDSLKRHWREWGMFDQGRQPWGHLHSTPLQIAFERGVPTLLVWLAWLFVYARTLWRMLRRGAFESWVERGLVLGALGGLAGFVTGGLVHYNFGDSEVVMAFYFIMGLALAAERLTRPAARGA